MQLVEFIQNTGQGCLIHQATDQDRHWLLIRCKRTGDDHAPQLVRQAFIDVSLYTDLICSRVLEFYVLTDSTSDTVRPSFWRLRWHLCLGISISLLAYWTGCVIPQSCKKSCILGFIINCGPLQECQKKDQ